MAITFIVEGLLALFVLLKRAAKQPEQRLIVAILVLLAIFQLAEYGVCEPLGFSPVAWARLGFVSITLLPAVGLHLIQKIRSDSVLVPTILGYAAAAAFAIAFAGFESFISVGCGGNYAIFQIKDGLGGMYFSYYYILLLVGIAMSIIFWAKDMSSERGKAAALMAIGYLSFVLPATYIHFVYENARNGLPSIMCGFALLFAVIIALAVSPLLDRSKD